MKQQIPLALCFLFGIIMILTEFSPHTTSQATYKEIANWGRVISPFVLVLAVVTLIQTHWTRITRRAEHWQYSFFVFAGMIAMVVTGVPFGPQDSVFLWLFDNVQVPMNATMFSLLAFFIASAAYRAFRARTLEATLLLMTAVIVMVGNVPLGDAASDASQWILDNPNLSARRGIILGVSLGAISQSIRIILGIERSYLGGGN